MRAARERFPAAAGDVGPGGDGSNKFGLFAGDLGEEAAGPHADVHLAEPCVEGDVSSYQIGERSRRGPGSRQIAGDDAIGRADVFNEPTGEPLRLLEPGAREPGVAVPLVAQLHVPSRFGVAHEMQAVRGAHDACRQGLTTGTARSSSRV